MKKPLPGTPSDNVAQTETLTHSSNDEVAQSTSTDTNVIPDSHSAHNAQSSRKATAIIAIIAIIAIAVGIYFLFFNKSKSKWEEYVDSDLLESESETEAADYYEDF